MDAFLKVLWKSENAFGRNFSKDRRIEKHTNNTYYVSVLRVGYFGFVQLTSVIYVAFKFQFHLRTFHQQPTTSRLSSGQVEVERSNYEQSAEDQENAATVSVAQCCQTERPPSVPLTLHPTPSSTVHKPANSASQHRSGGWRPY